MTQEEKIFTISTELPRDAVLFVPAEIRVDDTFCLLGYRAVGQYKARREFLYQFFDNLPSMLSGNIVPGAAALTVKWGACGKTEIYQYVEDIPLRTVPCCPGHALIRYESPLVF